MRLNRSAYSGLTDDEYQSMEGLVGDDPRSGEAYEERLVRRTLLANAKVELEVAMERAQKAEADLTGERLARKSADEKVRDMTTRLAESESISKRERSTREATESAMKKMHDQHIAESEARRAASQAEYDERHKEGRDRAQLMSDLSATRQVLADARNMPAQMANIPRDYRHKIVRDSSGLISEVVSTVQ